jgi:predicted nucleic acid-binding protein
MGTEQVFIDTNILLYAYDKEAGEKHDRARKKIEEAWQFDLPPAISVQVLQEFYVNLVKKRIPQKEAKSLVTAFLQWEIVSADELLFIEGIELQTKWQISFWDSMILAAAIKAKATTLWTEDFIHQQDYGGVKAFNPLV